MSRDEKKSILLAINSLQELIRLAYPTDEDACIEIKGDEVAVIGEFGEVREAQCTPTRALDRLLEDSRC